MTLMARAFYFSYELLNISKINLTDWKGFLRRKVFLCFYMWMPLNYMTWNLFFVSKSELFAVLSKGRKQDKKKKPPTEHFKNSF